MKPRERKPQKQSSRLYLRRKDHRDCIMNDTYHNAIWLKKTKDDGTVQDELAWCKYPQRAMIFGARLGGNGLYNSRNGIWILDVDRQIIHWASDASYMSAQYQAVSTRDYSVFLTGSTTYTGVALSKDGFYYKKNPTTFNNNPISYGLHRVGFMTNVLMNIRSIGSPYNRINISKYEILNYDENTKEYEIRDSYITQTIETSGNFDGYFIGTSPNGVIWAEPTTMQISGVGSMTYYRLFNIDVTGNVSVLADWDAFPYYVNNEYRGGQITNTRGNDILMNCKGHFFLSLPSRYALDGKYRWQTRILQSPDCRNWSGHDIGRVDTESQTLQNYPCMFVRKGRVYCYLINNTTYNTELYISSDDFSSWHEIALPDYVDVEISKTGCGWANPNPSRKYARLVFRPANAPSSSDAWNILFGRNISAEQERSTIFYRDGEMLQHDDDEADFGIYVSQWTANGYQGLFVYSESMWFEEGSEMFAFETIESSQGNEDQSEKVIEGDYVL